MADIEQSEPPIPIPGAMRRRSQVVSEESLVTTATLEGGKALPTVIMPSMEKLNLITWASGHHAQIESTLSTVGGILFRNWSLGGAEEFEGFLEAAFGNLLQYTNRSTPRTRVAGRVYTSTEYPPDQTIPFHNENSYSAQWPMRICFYCDLPSETGGETPIADSRAVWRRVPPEIRKRFAEVGVLYVRNYGYGMDLDWPEVFQTTNRADVEEYCNTWGMEFEWKSGDRLTTRQRLPAVTTHPTTGEPLWFNQAHLFHVSNLPAETQQELLALPREQLPRNAYYGNGEEIEQEVLDAIREAYLAETVCFPWKQGDVLLLDNMLIAHGRMPYSGHRRILTGMGISRTWDTEAFSW